MAGVGTDFIVNGTPQGVVSERMMSLGGDLGRLRPYFDLESGKRVVEITNGQRWDDEKGIYVPVREKVDARDIPEAPLANSGTLTKDAWIQLDSLMIEARRERLRAYADLEAASSFGGFNGWSKSTLEHQTVSDPGEAQVDMDGLTEGQGFDTEHGLAGIPLPITHQPFFLGSRFLDISRAAGHPLDLRNGRTAARRVAESVENTLIGTKTGVSFGGYSTYGYTNFPNRITKTDLTVPSGSNAAAILSDVLDMIELLQGAGFYGPYVLYHSTSFTKVLDEDRSATEPSAGTLRDRIGRVDGINSVRRLDGLKTGYQFILLQLNSEVAEAVNGMPMTPVQWETHGGMRLNFMIMAIMTQRLFADFYGNCGIVHATTA